jgi:hypothetical protein
MLKYYHYSISYLLDEIRCVVYFYNKERDEQQPPSFRRKNYTRKPNLQHNILFKYLPGWVGIKWLVYSVNHLLKMNKFIHIAKARIDRRLRCHKKCPAKHVSMAADTCSSVTYSWKLGSPRGRSVVTQLEPSRTFDVYSRSDWSVTYCSKLGSPRGRSVVTQLKPSHSDWSVTYCSKLGSPRGRSVVTQLEPSRIFNVYSRSERCQLYAVSTEEHKQRITRTK